MRSLTESSASEKSNRRLVAKLLGVTALSFAFGFALVPLYDVFCEITGLNGKTAGPGNYTVGGIGGAREGSVQPIDTKRVITVEFTDTVMPGLPWEISPQIARLEVHPGELHQGIRENCTKSCTAFATYRMNPSLRRRFQVFPRVLQRRASASSIVSASRNKRSPPAKQKNCRCCLRSNRISTRACIRSP